MKYLLFVFILGINQIVFAQSDILIKQDTVTVFAQRNNTVNVPAAVTAVASAELIKFAQPSFVQALNAVPGVKMDERSPGSYRLSIRGNLLRSTFGIRNVKIYLNELPLTDAGGNTYLNQYELGNFSSADVLRSPGGSLYGAGTGGVMFLKTESGMNNSFLQVTGGSYGGFSGEGKFAFEGPMQHQIYASHRISDGYRDQSALRRENLQYSFNAKTKRGELLKFMLLGADHFYQTPGALTKAQAAANPRAARPAAGMFRSAVQQRAAIYTQSLYGSFSAEAKTGTYWTSTVGVYGSLFNLNNPTIRNYEERRDRGFGTRFYSTYKKTELTVVMGAEAQYLRTGSEVFDNFLGAKSRLQFEDRITAVQRNAFLQGTYEFTDKFTAEAGVAVNKTEYDFQRLLPVQSGGESDFKYQPTGRLALKYKPSITTTVYVSAARGFSAPTVDEFHPSTGGFSQTLNAEKAMSYEAGYKGNFLRGKLFAEFTAYYTTLTDLITVARDASGADFFQNAGKATQAGAEFDIRYRAATALSARLSGSYIHARFGDYLQNGSQIKNNKLTGTPPFTTNAGVDYLCKSGWYANALYSFTDVIPVNNQNSVFAKAYNLLFLRAGKQIKISNSQLDLFASAQHAFNEGYSLGNDLNADGSRFFNPAPLWQINIGGRLSFSIK